MTVADALCGCGIEAFEARLLLAHASGLTRAALIAHPETVLDDAQAEAFRTAVEQRRAGQPIAYVVGTRAFHGLTLRVTPDVLIPRPETEMLVEFALERLPAGGAMLDLGTGSGAIALAVKLLRPDAHVTAVDRSQAALAVARANADHQRLDIAFVQGSWFEPLGGRRFEVIVSNPPYVAEEDRHLSQGDVRFEPRCALVGGRDGLEAIRSICTAAPAHLLPGGWLCVEHGQGQDPAVRLLFAQSGLESIASRPDLAGIPRIVSGRARS
ncbi:MAG: peptide chain release factor N(5)-glutamine methyltransferase [Betaproteobacteria bacterium]|nr:peptide chain release factor N(5)-glutamine methyltransferase [Betaproteobacteria bacterium]